MLPLVLLFPLVLAVLLSGCGEQAQTPTGADSVTVQVGAAAQRIGAFSAMDLLTDVGSRLDYAANAPGTSVRVDFDLDGPWIFKNGPEAATLSTTIVEKADAPSQNEFPDAAIAARYSWTPDAGMIEYNFQSKDDSSWRSFGWSGPGQALRIYSAGVNVLRFPAAAGDSWTENYSQTADGKVMEITAENQVVARNQLTVPAGTYDAVLLQTKVTATQEGKTTVTWDYIWFVPGIGRAAEIISNPGEGNEVFNTAASFYRLQGFTAP
jgi:hypothetical protein